MKKTFLFSALVLCSSSSFAGGLADNIDLSNSVLLSPPTTSDQVETATQGSYLTKHDIDLSGWVVQDAPKSEDQANIAGKPYAFSQHNPDLYGWVLNDTSATDRLSQL